MDSKTNCIKWELEFVFQLPGGNIGPALFTLRGNQGQSWKPVTVRYLGTAAIKVKTTTLNMSQYMCMCPHMIMLLYMSHLCVFQFVIKGTYGETPKTDIAVDAMCIMTCKGEKLIKGSSSVICNNFTSQRCFNEEQFIFHL